MCKNNNLLFVLVRLLKHWQKNRAAFTNKPGCQQKSYQFLILYVHYQAPRTYLKRIKRVGGKKEEKFILYQLKQKKSS